MGFAIPRFCHAGGRLLSASTFIVAMAVNGAGAADPALATARVPARICVEASPETLAALRRDEQRLVIVLSAFQPSSEGNSGFTVSLLGHDGMRTPVSRFAALPRLAFSAAEPRRSQRFLVSVAGQAALSKDGEPLCLEIGFVGPAPRTRGSRARVSVELVRMPEEGKA